MLFKENVCSSEDNLRNLWACKVAGTQLSLSWIQQSITFIPTSHLQKLLLGFLLFRFSLQSILGWAFELHWKFLYTFKTMDAEPSAKAFSRTEKTMRGCSRALWSLFPSSNVSAFQQDSHTTPLVIPAAHPWLFPRLSKYPFQIQQTEWNSFSRCGNMKIEALNLFYNPVNIKLD